MLQPKRVKWRRSHRGRRRGQANAGNQVTFGEFGLQAQANAWVTARQIEAARRAITHSMKGGGKVWIRIFPDKPDSNKPPETPTGRGQGAARVLGSRGEARTDAVRDRGRAGGAGAGGAAPGLP